LSFEYECRKSAGGWAALFDESDVDGEFPRAFEKLLRPIERIHQPETPVHIRDAARWIIGFLGDDRDARNQAGKEFHEKVMRRAIGVREGRGVTFQYYGCPALVEAHGPLARFLSQGANLLQG
jgi:hypothetical protein